MLLPSSRARLDVQRTPQRDFPPTHATFARLPSSRIVTLVLFFREANTYYAFSELNLTID